MSKTTNEFSPEVRDRAVRLDLDNEGQFGALGSQAHHDPGKDAVVAPTFPEIVNCLGRTVSLRRAEPSQPIAIVEYYSDQNAPVIDAGFVTAFGE